MAMSAIWLQVTVWEIYYQEQRGGRKWWEQGRQIRGEGEVEESED